jgi:hypothetical protein
MCNLLLCTVILLLNSILLLFVLFAMKFTNLTTISILAFRENVWMQIGQEL